jgi:hypothetical protein
MFNKIIRSVKLSEIKPTNPNVGWESGNDLLTKVINNYDVNVGIIISTDMKILDGNHRYYLMVEVYGLDYEIKVRQTKYHSLIWYLFILLSSPLILCIILITSPLILIKKIHKLINQNKND